MLPAPLAILLERDFTLHFADVFSRPVVVALADSALETDEVWLGHKEKKRVLKLKA